MGLPLIVEISSLSDAHDRVSSDFKQKLLTFLQLKEWRLNIKFHCPELNIDCIRFCNDSDYKLTDIEINVLKDTGIDINDKLECYLFSLEDSLASCETMGGFDDESAITTSQNWMLPCKALDDLWENLFFEGCIKLRLLQYAQTCLKLGKAHVNPSIIQCNRLILLHGPPGSGKTTVCRAVSQKLSIRLQDVYPRAQLVEINCHSLFSKWFSESGKLVSKMFSTIRQYAEDEQMLVIVLIDEVESLTAARQAAINSNEPSDAIRVVNAVLTQLDALRFLGNVLVLATSNLTDAIDCAFTDRADIITYIGPPGPEERLLILNSCLEELERAHILVPSTTQDRGELVCAVSACEGLSGRTIRKLPVLALANMMPKLQAISRQCFLCQLLLAAQQMEVERKLLRIG